MNLQESIRRILREETEYVKDVRVKISDILKTNRDGQSLDDAIVNVQDGLKSYSEGPPFLLKIGDKYEVLDGFHRIAQKILDGKKYIISDVMIKESNINLQESIRRVLREELNYTNLSVNIGDVYEESDIYTYIQKLHYKRDYDFWEGDIGERIEKFPYYIVKEVPIENIEMDEYQLDEDDMEEYIEMFKKRGSYPPIVLGEKSYGYYNIIDGTHRANALRELGFDKIICFVGKKKI